MRNFRKLGRGALQWAFVPLIWASLLWASCARPTPTPSKVASTPTLAFGTVRVFTTPEGASVYLDDIARGESPNVLDVRAGQHVLRLEKTGYAPLEFVIAVEPGQELYFTETLHDNTPPQVYVVPLPASVELHEGLKVSATATDNVGVTRLAMWVDGQLIAESKEPFLRHNLDTRSLPPGQHQLVIEAQDAAGNSSHQQTVFTLLEPTVRMSVSLTPLLTPTLSPTVPAHPTPSATPTPKPTQATQKPVAVSWGEVTIDTYDYKQALYVDPERAGHPYPLLDRGRIGPPRPRTYKTLSMRNDYLDLTLLPELGGRIYQCRFLPTGQELFYNNRVIKPSHWGPPEQGWWLAVGGMEFCLPVEEHGYVTAEPWSPSISQHPDGSATVTMSIEERSRGIEARVDITLRPGEGGFHLRSTLYNPSEEAKALQYWINAMLSPGGPSVRPSLRFYYPASQVIVHSRGDNALPSARSPMSWPIYNGRDLSCYANWRDWLGFFAPALSQPFTAVYDEASQLGLVRVFPADVARGVKLFAFGLDFRDSQAYTDDGTQYVEMWGGWTPTFWDYGVLAPKATLSWEETWCVLSQCGGPVLATSEASLSVARDAESIEVTVAALREQRWSLRLEQGPSLIAQQDFTVRPDRPFRARFALKAGHDAGQVTITVTDALGNPVLAYTI